MDRNESEPKCKPHNESKPRATWVQGGKRDDSVNVLASLSIQTKRTKENDNGPRSGPPPLMEVQCEVRAKSKEWITRVGMTDDACQLNVVRQFLVKELGLQVGDPGPQAVNFDG